MLACYVCSTKIGENSDISKCFEDFVSQALGFLTRSCAAELRYIGKWYNLNKNAPWYNSHLKKNCYRGYWAWEVAAVAKIMHIDDSGLKDNSYYPYDMVHWEDTGTTTEE